jgi:glycosyltransferase involved in cell wall biosynthesis
VTPSPPVTAVVPTHNRPEMMRRAVQSILSQDYPGEIEVVVVFDACPEEAPAVDLPVNRTVRTVSNSRSRGLAGARNTGIDQASHGYIAFLDDDDMWLDGKLAAQMERFEHTPRPVLVGSAMVADDGARKHERLVPLDDVGHADLLRDRMAGLHSSTFVFDTETLRSIGMVDEHLPGSYGEDYDLLLRTAKAGRIVVVNRPLVSVNWAGQSYFFGRWAAYADGLTYLLEAHPEFSDDRRALGRIQSQIAFARAAAQERRAGRTWALQALRSDPRQIKAWLALAISLRLLSAPFVVRTVQRMGKGI